MPASVGSIVRATAMDPQRDREIRFPWPPYGVSVLVFVHADCVHCGAFLQSLDEHGHHFHNWGSTVWVAHSEVAPAPAESTSFATVREVVDQTGRLHTAAEVDQDQPAVLILDVHGQVYFSEGVTDHVFPDVDDLLVEARFPALQCPECDTPDVPSQADLPSPQG